MSHKKVGNGEFQPDPGAGRGGGCIVAACPEKSRNRYLPIILKNH